MYNYKHVARVDLLFDVLKVEPLKSPTPSTSHLPPSPLPQPAYHSTSFLALSQRCRRPLPLAVVNVNNGVGALQCGGLISDRCTRNGL